jgi:hypothetical protein
MESALKESLEAKEITSLPSSVVERQTFNLVVEGSIPSVGAGFCSYTFLTFHQPLIFSLLIVIKFRLILIFILSI